MADIRLKIVSDGTANGTRIVDAETGVEVGGIQAVSWSVAYGDVFAAATFKATKIPVEVEAVNPAWKGRPAIRLRLHPDGHWIPDMPGQWDYTPGPSYGGDALTLAIGDAILWKAKLDRVPDDRPNEATTCYEGVLETIGRMAGARPTPQRVTVYEYKGGLNVRFPEGDEESVRTVAPGTWEWVTPTGDEGGKG